MRRLIVLTLGACLITAGAVAETPRFVIDDEAYVDKVTAASARLLEVRSQVFSDDEYRQLVQSDNLDNTIEEVSGEVVITWAEPPSVARDLA